MSVAAAALALARPFEFQGQTYQLRPLTYEDLARFSLWLEERAKAAAFRAMADGEDPKTIWGAFLDRVAAGAYEPGGDVFDQATRSNAGSRKILQLMLAPPAEKKLPDRWQESTSWEVYAEPKEFERATKLMQEINSDPNAVRGRRIPAPPAAPSR